MPTETKRDHRSRGPRLETDAPALAKRAKDQPLPAYGEHVGRVRREFLCEASIRLLVMQPFEGDGIRFTGYSVVEAVDEAEKLMLELQRRGILP